MLKKSTLLLLGLLAGNDFAIAGTSNISSLPTCSAEGLTIPCEMRLWDLGIQALYLKPSFGSAIGYTSTAIPQGINPAWNWGYRLQGSYHLNTGNDLTMNWSHYDGNTGAHNYQGQFPLINIGIIAAPYQLLLNTKYDQVNLVVGQHINAGPMRHARFYGGLQYASFKVDENSYYQSSPLFIPITGGNVIDSNAMDFNGVGPVFGVDYVLGLTPRWSINANTSGSLVYGTSRFNYATAYGNGLVARAFYGSQKFIIPSLEAKLGANYAYQMPTGVLNVEGGYQAVNYFNALRTSPTPGIVGMGRSDFGMFGPYFGIRWLGVA